MLRRSKREPYLTLLKDVKYLGSHPSIQGHFEGLTLVFYSDRLGIRDRKGNENVNVAWPDVSALMVLDRHEAERSVSFASVALLGVFALLGPKKNQSFLEIVDRNGTWLFAIPGLNPVELRGGLQQIHRRCLAHIPAGDGQPAGPGRADPEQRLLRLEQLRAQGLITEEEYGSRRSAIVNEL